MKKTRISKSRRNFLKNSTFGLVGASILPPVIKGEKRNGSIKPGKKHKLISRTLGETGLSLPVISMGVMNADNPRLVEAALDAGIVHLDTAWYYQWGRNEKMIGEVLKGRPRDSYVIATKIFEIRNLSTGLFPEDAKPDTFLKKFSTSLERLGLDYVDILYLHDVTSKEMVMFEPYLDTMVKLKKEGKTRFIGVSTHRNEPEVLRTAADSHVYDVVLTAYNFKQQHREEIKKAIAYAANAGLGIIGMKAIAGSIYNFGEKIISNPKAALKWVLQDKNITTIIAGFTTFDQMETDLSVMENLALTPEEKHELEQNPTVAGLFCQQCEKCIPQCPYNLDIPNLMRSYLYAVGYKKPGLAKDTLESINLSSLPCTQCGSCRVNCSFGFDIKKRILYISRLKDVPKDFLAG